jgi:hypothetical protein
LSQVVGENVARANSPDAMPWTNGCSSAASARTRFWCHNESASETTNQATAPHGLATASVDDPNRSQRWDPWIEPDRQSVGPGDAMSLVGGAGAAGRCLDRKPGRR